MTIYKTEPIITMPDDREVHKVTVGHIEQLFKYIDDVDKEDVCKAFDQKYKGTPTWTEDEKPHTIEAVANCYPMEEQTKAVFELTDEHWIILEVNGLQTVEVAKLKEHEFLNNQEEPRFITERTIERITNEDEDLPTWITGDEDWVKQMKENHEDDS